MRVPTEIVDDQLSALEFALQPGVLPVQLLDLPGCRVRLRAALLGRQRCALGHGELLAPTR